MIDRNGVPTESTAVVRAGEHPQGWIAPAGPIGVGPVGVIGMPTGAMAASALPDLNLQPLAARRSLAQVLWRGKWLLLLGVAAGLGGAYGYCKHATKIYTDSARLFVSDVAMHGDADPTSPAALTAQVELIRSTPLMERAAALSDAAAMQTFRHVDNVPAALRDSLTVEPGQRVDSILTLSIDTPYPAEGVRLLNGVIAAYREQAAQQRQDTADNIGQVLQRQLVDAKADESAAVDRMRKFREANPSLNTSASGGGELDQTLGGLAAKADDLRMRTVDLRDEIDKDNAALANPEATQQRAASLVAHATSGSAGDPYAVAAGQLGRARYGLQQLTLGGHGPSDPQTLTAQKQVNDAAAAVPAAAAASVTAHLQDAQSQMQTLARQQSDLATQMANVRDQVGEANAKLADYAALQGQLTTAQTQRSQIEQKLKGLTVTAQAGGMAIKVVDPATAGTGPVWPQWNRSLAVGGLVGAMLGLMGALVQANLDVRLRTADEVVEELGLPVLGAVPHIRGRKLTGPTRARMVQLQPSTAVAEAYRTIRTSLYFGAVHAAAGRRPLPAGGPRRVLVTSPMPGDGKSTCASNLAIAMAQSGRRVVLVDADLRRPIQQANHEMSPAPGGLADVFAGRTPLSKLVRRTSVDRLHLLAGGPVASAAELITSPLFSEMLDSLNRVCDVVVIDSPPVLPVSDARILATGCDATILVLRADKTTRRLARQARDGLLSVGANLAGIVVNDVPRASAGYGYGGAYGSGYGGAYAAEVTDLPSVVAPPGGGKVDMAMHAPAAAVATRPPNKGPEAPAPVAAANGKGGPDIRIVPGGPAAVPIPAGR